MSKLLEPTADLIHRVRDNMNVLVHCHMGKQRSVSVVLAYLLKYGRMNLKEASDFLRTKRPKALTPGFNFIKAFENFGKKRVGVPTPRDGFGVKKKI